MTQANPGRDSRLVGQLVDHAERLPRNVQSDGRRIGVLEDRGRAKAGKVLGGGRDPRPLLCLDEIRA